MSPALRLVGAAWLAALLMSGSLLASDWPAFRGANGGVAPEQGLPDQITKANVLWKTKLPGVGTSSPIIVGNKIYLTCYTGYGTTITRSMLGGSYGKGGFGKGGFGKGGGPDGGGDQKNLRLSLACFDRDKGQLVWQKEIEPKLPEVQFTGYVREHGYASSTPASDGENVYVFFGKSGVLAFDLAGNKLWQASVGTGTDKWGSAASPIVVKNLVIVNAAVESHALIALDNKTGKEAWRTKGVGTSWVTPILVDTKDGKQEIVMSQPGKVVGYDPETGKELWHCQGIGGSSDGGGFGGFVFGSYTCSTPVAKDGIVYVIGGGGPTPQTSLAVKTGGQGDVDKTHVLWRKKLGSSTCSPVLSGDCLVWVSGSATALGLTDGKTVYQERLYNGWNEYVSAVAVGDKIYALTRTEGLYVLAGGSKFKELSRFEFEGDRSIFNASPAVSDGKLFVRSNDYLYCLGKAK